MGAKPRVPSLLSKNDFGGAAKHALGTRGKRWEDMVLRKCGRTDGRERAVAAGGGAPDEKRDAAGFKRRVRARPTSNGTDATKTTMAAAPPHFRQMSSILE